MVSNKYNESLVEGIPTPKVFHEFRLFNNVFIGLPLDAPVIWEHQE